MNLAIITLNDHKNYGNRLQNYALQTILLADFGDVHTLWDSTDYNPLMLNYHYSIKSVIKYILNWKNQREDLGKYYVRNLVREYNIKTFSNRNIMICYNFIYDEIIKKYDYFIVGSDQVWNPLFWSFTEKCSDAYFLQFADERKRIAYAASFGISELPSKYIDTFKRGLDGIPYISVREQAGADIIKRITGRDVPVLVDPTLLLDAEHWRTLEMQPEWYRGEKYILTYFLGNVPPIIDNIAKEHSYKIYNLMDKECLDLYVSRVEEFLYLIDNAELVCTDSFHACVFSILFNTPFVVVDRQQEGIADMTSRLDTLLGLFGYQDRLIDFAKSDIDANKLMTMDFSKVKEIQEREISRSTAFLKEAMHIE